MNEDLKELIVFFVFLGTMAFFIMSPFIVATVYSLLQTPEQMCAEQTTETDFCKGLLNNPNLTLKK